MSIRLYQLRDGAELRDAKYKGRVMFMVHFTSKHAHFDFWRARRKIVTSQLFSILRRNNTRARRNFTRAKQVNPLRTICGEEKSDYEEGRGREKKRALNTKYLREE